VTCCPDHDPILLAASIICGTCKSESFPSDAGWMPDGTILVNYVTTHEPHCAKRPQFGMVLLVPGDSQLVPRVQRPRICRGTTKANRPCRNPAGKASAWCSSHDPARRAA
jgi:hypothetical protein